VEPREVRHIRLGSAMDGRHEGVVLRVSISVWSAVFRQVTGPVARDEIAAWLMGDDVQ
jgi:hypothetical protein